MLQAELSGRVAIVTGENNPYGIGAAIAQTLARRGRGGFLALLPDTSRLRVAPR